MYQKFNSNTLITKFIKDLLKDTYIPNIEIYNIGDNIIAGFMYIVDGYICRAIKDYFIEEGNPPQGLNTIYFEIVQPYILGEFYPSISSNFQSNISAYDSETHKYLGNYLRLLRDYKHIDLMSYYNCWGGLYSDKIRIVKKVVADKQEVDIIQYNNKIDGLTTLLVPIKFNQKYTIYCNSIFPIWAKATYYDGKNIYDTTDITNELKEFSCSYSNPYLYQSPIVSGESFMRTTISEPTWKAIDKRYAEANTKIIANQLYLVLQLPQTASENILVLEGDYRDNKFINTNNDTNQIKKVFAGPDKTLTYYEAEKLYPSISSLTRNISSNSYPFNDRLIEYLLHNVITLNDEITEDINRIQKYISSYKMNNVLISSKKDERYKEAYTKGIWNNSMRNYIYQTVTQNIKSPLRIDINGYVDKDTEKVLLGAK